MTQDSKRKTYTNIPSIWLRIKALLIDYLVILAWIAIVGLVGFVISVMAGGYPDYLGAFGPFGAQIIFFLVMTFPVGAYLYLTESGTHHATFGKRKVGIRVVGSDGGMPSKRSILLRTIIKLLPWEVAHTFVWQMQYVFYRSGYEAEMPEWIFVGLSISIILVVIYIGMIALRPDGRGPHDLLAGTLVVLR